MNYPENIKYAKSHEWLRIEGKEAYVGLSDFAQSELGDIVFVDVTAAEGDELKKGDSFGTIEAVKTVSDIYMPVAGRILAINQTIVDSPETINKDPYGDGWLVKIELTNAGQADELLSAGAYGEMVGAEH